MHRTKITLMKFTSLLIALFATISFTTSAQTDNTDDINRFSRDQSDRMADDLGLSDDQRQKLHKQNSAYYMHQQSVHDKDLAGEERGVEMDRYQKDHDKKMREILDNDQYERYNKSRDRYTPEYNRTRRATPTQEGEKTDYPYKE